MATQRTSFAKLQRDREKQARSAAKRERRQEREAEAAAKETAPEPLLDDSGRKLEPAELLELVSTVHRQFEAGDIDFETFEEAKTAILQRLPVD
ncbi:MAG: hypothetical protein ACRD0J_16085 [Acidimicrobiales bacterium]